MDNIIICFSCKGTGKTEHWESGHNPDKIIETCGTCRGTGRLITHDYHITVPFGTDEKKCGFYEVDSKINQLRRDYEERCYSIILNESPLELHEEN
jgi:hypothetical protein